MFPLDCFAHLKHRPGFLCDAARPSVCTSLPTAVITYHTLSDFHMQLAGVVLVVSGHLTHGNYILRCRLFQNNSLITRKAAKAPTRNDVNPNNKRPSWSGDSETASVLFGGSRDMRSTCSWAYAPTPHLYARARQGSLARIRAR